MPEPTLPKHVAIIMDGNGRWAERRGRPRIYGHIRGSKRVKDIIKEADRLGVKALTLFAFSSENWGRPDGEVSILMRLLQKWLIRERHQVMKKNIRFRAIGAVDRLPREVGELVRSTTEVSQANTGLQLTLALSYGSREEILAVTRKLAEKARQGQLLPDEIDADMFSSSLFTAEIGDPDLLIRTSGELRISNFLLWQLAYTELYFTDAMWPDFSPENFRAAVESYSRRQRRFGLTAAQIEVRT